MNKVNELLNKIKDSELEKEKKERAQKDEEEED